MQKDSKCINTYSAGNALFARTVNIAWPDNDVWEPASLSILGNDLVLFHFCKAIGIATQMRTRFNGAGLIELPPLALVHVGIHCERTHVDKSFQGLALQTRFHEVTSRDNRVHERVGKGLVTSTRSQVKNRSRFLGC